MKTDRSRSHEKRRSPEQELCEICNAGTLTHIANIQAQGYPLTGPHRQTTFKTGPQSKKV